MRIIFSLLLLCVALCVSALSYASLTAGVVPVTKTGGSTPLLQNGSITDTGTASGAGNVGIGSSNPGTTLDVLGTVRAIAYIGNGSGLTGINFSQWTTQNTTDVSLAGGNIGIGTTITNAGAALSIMNGNVGIGTWKPIALLDTTKGTLEYGTLGNTSGMSITSVISYTGGTTTGTVNNCQGNSMTSGICFNSSSSGNSFTGNLYQGTYSGSGSGSAASFTHSNASATGSVLKISNAGLGNAITVTGTGNINVGIGTATARQAFDVIGTVRASSFMGPGAATPFNGSCGTTAVTSITVDHGVITSCTGV